MFELRGGRIDLLSEVDFINNVLRAFDARCIELGPPPKGYRYFLNNPRFQSDPYNPGNITVTFDIELIPING